MSDTIKDTGFFHFPALPPFTLWFPSSDLSPHGLKLIAAWEMGSLKLTGAITSSHSHVQSQERTGSGRSPGEGNGNPLQILPGKSHGQSSLVGYSPWGHKRVGHNLTTKTTTTQEENLTQNSGKRFPTLHHVCITCSCLKQSLAMRIKSLLKV